MYYQLIKLMVTIPRGVWQSGRHVTKLLHPFRHFVSQNVTCYILFVDSSSHHQSTIKSWKHSLCTDRPVLQVPNISTTTKHTTTSNSTLVHTHYSDKTRNQLTGLCISYLFSLKLVSIKTALSKKLPLILSKKLPLSDKFSFPTEIV